MFINKKQTGNVKLCKVDDLYIITGQLNQNLKRLGFRWDNLRNAWVTKDDVLAYHFRKIADKQTAEWLWEEVGKVIHLSQASTLPEEYRNFKFIAPEGLSYFEHQKVAILYSLVKKNVLIADEMGMGKTIETIGILNHSFADRKSSSMILIVCPNIVKRFWKNEIGRWYIRKHKTMVIDSHVALDVEKVIDGGNHDLFIIVNYELLYKWNPILESIVWDCLILDEAHHIKNPKTKKAKAILGDKSEELYPLKAKRKLAITGTPIMNRPAELFNILKWLEVDIADSYISYIKKYCNAKQTQWGWKIEENNDKQLSKLQDTLRYKVMIRRTKNQCAFPIKMRQIIELPVDYLDHSVEEVRKEIEILRAKMVLAKISFDDKTYLDNLKKLTQSYKLAFAHLPAARKRIGMLKLPFIIEHLRNVLLQIDKAVFVCIHRDILTKVYEEFSSCSVILLGGISETEKIKRVEKFHKDRSVKLVLSTISSACEGSDLSTASLVVFGELDLRPSKMLQVEDRCHRITQKSSVLIQMLVMPDSIDSQLAKFIVSKLEAFDKYVGLDASYNTEMIDFLINAKTYAGDIEDQLKPVPSVISNNDLKSNLLKIKKQLSSAYHEYLINYLIERKEYIESERRLAYWLINNIA